MSRGEHFDIGTGPRGGRLRQIPVERVGYLPPLPPRHDPGAMIEPEEGTRHPKGFSKVVGALSTNAIKPTAIDPTTTPLRATQTRLTRGALERHADGFKPSRINGGTDPVLYREGDEHFVIDGHHRVANAMLRGEQFHATVLENSPAHRKLARQTGLAGEHLRSAWGAAHDAVEAKAREAGVQLYPRWGQSPQERTPAAEALIAEKNAAFHRVYPEWAKNKERRSMGLPPKKR